MNTNTLGWISTYLSILSHQIKGNREIAGTSLRCSPSGKKKSSDLCTSIQSFGPASFCMWCKDVGGRFGKISLKDFGKGMKIHMMKYIRCTSPYALKKGQDNEGFHISRMASSGYNHYTVCGIFCHLLFGGMHYFLSRKLPSEVIHVV